MTPAAPTCGEMNEKADGKIQCSESGRSLSQDKGSVNVNFFSSKKFMEKILYENHPVEKYLSLYHDQICSSKLCHRQTRNETVADMVP